ncbi:predicted protein [Nematostella vectensis]|uniref:Ku70/Ku80 N-terminal alpha/beta domain-containing protein n=1 Tax=Nematostella vectensis TaxID=45351 RepID=A7SI23_NEMVE|nr:predicted protein [Nematostella vectensis]|eukprot:XP_001628738.1 predicted protein [Nematostella vectensis]
MAAKDAVAIILDIGPSMSSAPPGHETSLELSIKAINMIIQRKMFANAKDEFSLILFGTEETSNRLNEECGGYENISVVKDLAPPDLEMLRFIHDGITPGLFTDKNNNTAMHSSKPVIDAVVVAMDLLREKTRGKKCDKKIYLFTDLGSPFGNDQLDKIVDGLMELDAQFVLVGPRLVRYGSTYPWTYSGTRPSGSTYPWIYLGKRPGMVVHTHGLTQGQDQVGVHTHGFT